MGVGLAVANADEMTSSVNVVQASDASSDYLLTAPSTVQGTFSFSQDQLTSTSSLGVFNKAAAALCAALPEYATQSASMAIAVAENGTYVGTVDELASEDRAFSKTVGSASFYSEAAAFWSMG